VALADGVSDHALHAVLARIAADEQRHAELSWRALAWLLRSAGEEDTAWVSRCFEETIAGAEIDPEPRARVAPEHGVLASADLGAIRRRALREVVAPCAAALLDDGGSWGRLLAPCSS
jgi:hypothetical protein